MVGDLSKTSTTVHSLHSENDQTLARASSLSFLQNRRRRLSTAFPQLSLQSDNITRSETDIHGPVGLNLLFEPSEPRIDFVFIHGLGGGSRKTWSHSPDPGMFWPKEWLPNEVGFGHVRLHSFGYNSDWMARKSSHLAVHDFGQALLADLHNSPYLRKNGDAYLLATQDPIYKGIAGRIHTMYFLGTPHRGANSAHLAKLLSDLMGYGKKAFLRDLEPGCRTLDEINDAFRHVCENIHLWSFTEGVPTSFGLTSSLIVDKESAVLGLPREHVQYIEADHRNICKFDTPTNPNYMILQRAFLTTIEDMAASHSSQKRGEYKSQMKKVASFLRVDQRPDAVLLATNEKKHPGSCQWLTESHAFQEWVDSPVDIWGESAPSKGAPEEVTRPKVLWLNGRPGTGKSVAAGHVIRYLQSCNLDCSFYFFEHKNKSGSTMAALLRSLAFQMAESIFEVRRTLASMAEDDVRINLDDHRMLWASVFTERIFKVGRAQPQYWVIDAADECSTEGMPALVSMLSNLDCKTPVRLFVTSPPGGQLGRALSIENTEVSEITTGREGSLKDIELLVRAKWPGASDAGQSPDLVPDILAKCNGIFLWASLTVSKLENAYSVEDKQEILREIPLEMDTFYSRIVTSIAESPSFELAGCILKWVICAPEPLYYRELEEAVKLDIGKTLTASKSQLEALTGHLVLVDNQSQLHITHHTASAFLTQKRDGLWIDRATAHSTLARVCLSVLGGADFAPPRIRRRGKGVTAISATSSPLAGYAALNFTYHLMLGSPAADEPFKLLNDFLKSNVLAWIEKTASTGNLWTIQLAAQRLKAYQRRRAKCKSSGSVESQTIARWAADMHHIVAAFHSSLLTSPTSIYFLIPHFCPPKSIIRELFAKPTRHVRIAGSLEEDWNDRLACYVLPEEASAVACCTRFLAVGLTGGDVRIYNIAGPGTFNLAATLTHGKKVRQLAFNQSSSLLASCSVRKLMLWDTHASRGSSFPCFWSRDIDFTPSYVAFHPDGNSVVLGNQQYSSIVAFRAEDGQRKPPVLLHTLSDSDSSDESDQQPAAWVPSQWIRLDANHKLAALAYRNAPVSVWDLESVEEIGKFEKEGFEDIYCTPPPLDMVFNPIPELELLAITYQDGDIVTCNPWTLDQKNKCHLQTHLGSLATTSDGRILAGATDDGEIYLFLFKTLQPIYKIGKPDNPLRIHDVVFSADNLRFFDIRGHCCTLWEPSILLPEDDLDESSSETLGEESITLESPVSRARVFEWGRAITAIDHAACGNFIIVGRQDGAIDICELNTGTVIDKLELHGPFTEIAHLDWNDEKNLLLSVDTTGRCILTRLSLIEQATTKVQTCCLLDHRERAFVRQALIGPKAESLLIRTESATKVIGLEGSILGEETSLPGSWWIKHPSNNSHLIAIQENSLHLFEWDSLTRPFHTNGITLLSPEFPKQATRYPWISGVGSGYVAQCTVESPIRTSTILSLGMSQITSETKEISFQILRAESFNVHLILGCLKSRLFILDTDGWVCSISLKTLSEATHYTRHFFIPLTWRAGGGIVIKVLSKTAVAFGRGEQLIILHGFLEFEDAVTFQGQPSGA